RRLAPPSAPDLLGPAARSTGFVRPAGCSPGVPRSSDVLAPTGRAHPPPPASCGRGSTARPDPPRRPSVRRGARAFPPPPMWRVGAPALMRPAMTHPGVQGYALAAAAPARLQAAAGRDAVAAPGQSG